MTKDPEPVTASPPRAVRLPLATVRLQDVAFVHWAVAPEVVRPLVPTGTRPDLWDGSAYVGLVALRVAASPGPLAGPPLPYLGSFAQTNVRTYTVDDPGRRGLAFLSMDAARLLPGLLGRVGRLPYHWSRVRVQRRADVVTYRCARRGGEVGSRLAVRIGEPAGSPDPRTLFLTARWGLHVAVGGRLRYVVAEHEPWPLYEASVVELRDTLVPAALRTAGRDDAPVGPPAGVLWSPGVCSRFGV